MDLLDEGQKGMMEKIMNFVTLSLFFFLPFPHQLLSLSIIVWVGCFIAFKIHEIKNGQISLPDYKSRSMWGVYALLLFYMIALCSAFYAASPQLVFQRMFGSRFVFFVLPFCALFGLPSIVFDKILKAFVWGVFAFLLYSFACGIYKFQHLDSIQLEYIRRYFSYADLFPIHRIYSCSSVAVAYIASVLLWIRHQFSTIEKWIWGVFAALSLFYLLLSNSRTSVALILLLGAFYVVYFLRHKRKYLFSAVVASAVLFGVMFTVPSRFQQSMKTIFSSEQKFSDPRFDIWKCVNNVSPDYFFSGLGTNNYLEPLKEEYIKNGFYDFAKNNYWTHNQYLECLIETGWLGVFSLLLMLPMVVCSMPRKRMMFGNSFLFYIFCTLLIECFLSRANGACLFVFFAVFLSAKELDGRPKA